MEIVWRNPEPVEANPPEIVKFSSYREDDEIIANFCPVEEVFRNKTGFWELRELSKAAAA